jgi:hypothetical protein
LTSNGGVSDERHANPQTGSSVSQIELTVCLYRESDPFVPGDSEPHFNAAQNIGCHRSTDTRDIGGGRIILAMIFMVWCSSDAVAGDQPDIVISFSHASPDTADWRRFAPWIQQRPFDSVVRETDPRDATWHNESY